MGHGERAVRNADAGRIAARRRERSRGLVTPLVQMADISPRPSATSASTETPPVVARSGRRSS
jgi:hypothetical protein